jgi:hypothetical protein
MIDGSDSEERRPQDGSPIRVKSRRSLLCSGLTHQGLVGFKSHKFDFPCFYIPYFLHFIPYIGPLSETLPRKLRGILRCFYEKIASVFLRLSNERVGFFNKIIL